jgi:hypothetical protein
MSDRLTHLRHHLQGNRRDWKAIREDLVSWIEDPDADLKVAADYVLQALKQVDDRAQTMDRIFRSEQEIVRLREENKRLKDAMANTPRREDRARTGPVNERRGRDTRDQERALRNLWGAEAQADMGFFHGTNSGLDAAATALRGLREAVQQQPQEGPPQQRVRTASEATAEETQRTQSAEEMDLLESLWSDPRCYCLGNCDCG